MGRWTQYDEDEYRLPQGMKRVGYDADTQTYIYQSSDGTFRGQPGERYGELTRKSPNAMNTADVEATNNAEYAAATRTSPYRMLFPICLIIVVFMLLVIRYTYRASHISDSHCLGKSHWASTGESCWSISQTYHMSLDDLLSKNSGLDCDILQPGRRICV